MTETRAAEADRVPTGGRVRRWLILVVVGLAAAVLLWVMGSAVLPRWWAQRMSNLIDGRLTAGSVFGLCIGALFTVLPLTVLAAGWRFRRGWKRFAGFVIAAAILAGPNLATLGIVLGNGNAAHAGQRILDVDGPGFRGGSLVGAVIGALSFAAVWWLAFSRRRNKERAKGLAAELADR